MATSSTVCFSCALALLLLGCTPPDDPRPTPRLAAVALPDASSPVLLRPRGITIRDDGQIWVVEEGRQTVTALDPATQRATRRPLWPGRLPEGMSASPAAFFGAVLARGADALYTMAPGLGPLRIPDDPNQAPEVLGAGTRGNPPAHGASIPDTDLSDIRGLAWDGRSLVVAIGDDLWRLGDVVAAVPVELPGGADLRLGAVVGLAFDESQRLFVTDAASGRIWRIAPDGAAEAVAGRGGDLAPATPGAALGRTLELGLDQLVYDPVHDALTLLVAGQELWRIGLDAGGAHTIEPLRTTHRYPAGLGVLPEGGVLISALEGAVSRRPQGGEEVAVWPATSASVELGRGAGIAAVGTTATLIADPAQRRLALHIPGEGVFELWRENAPTSRQPGPLTGDQSAQVYFLTSLGLQWLDLAGGLGQRIAQRQPEPLVEGQLISAVALPATGELRSDGVGTLWLLDQVRRIVVRFDEVTGAGAHIAGATRGGGQPREEMTNPARQLALQAPSNLVAGSDLLLLADATAFDGGVVYAVNIAQTELAIAGRTIPPGDAGHLGGGGDSAWAVGLPFGQLRLERVTAVARDGEALWLAADSPALFRVDAQGLLEAVPDPPPDPPDVLATVAQGVVLLGWEDSGAIEALNVGETAVSVLGVDVGPGARVPVMVDSDGVRDLVVSGAGAVYALGASGGIAEHTADQSRILGEVGEAAQTLALTGNGGLLALDGAGIWGVKAEGAAAFLGEPLPSPPGELVVLPVAGFPPDTRLANLPFGATVLALAADTHGALYWVDGGTQSLYRASVTEAAHVEGVSRVALLAQGVPVPAGNPPTTLAVNADDVVFLGVNDGVHRLADGGWSIVLGGGSSAPAVGLDGAEVAVTDVSGVAAVGDSVWIRARQGLIEVDGLGRIATLAPSLATDPSDSAAVAYAQTLAAVGDDLFLVLAGGVYRLVP